jgi:hypothetical protein
VVRSTFAALRCVSGADCVCYPALGEPSKLSRGNPGPRCFACERQGRDLEFEAVAAKPKATKPKERGSSERLRELPTTERAGAAFVGHQHAAVSRTSAIRERRRASVLTCERGLQAAIVSDDARLMRTWSKSLRDAEARLLWAEADLEASEKKARSEQRP